MVVMSSKLYDKFAKINRIAQVIYESEQEIANEVEAKKHAAIQKRRFLSTFFTNTGILAAINILAKLAKISSV